jgi:hypothetical protein
MVRVHPRSRTGSTGIVNHVLQHLRGTLIALAALALSAGLAFGAQPEGSWGLTNASAHAGKTVPVRAGQQVTDEDADEDTDEDTDDLEDEDTDEEVENDATGGGENCSTDPPGLTPEELAELKHGSIVCWAAHQKEWPEWFAKHGEFVKCWAHNGKAEAPSCTEDPNAEEPVAEEDAAATSVGHGRGQGKGKGHNK